MSAERFGIAKSQWQVGGGSGGQLLLDSFENPVRVWEGEVGAWKKIGFDGTRGFGGDALNPVRVWEGGGRVGGYTRSWFDGTRGFGGGAWWAVEGGERQLLLDLFENPVRVWEGKVGAGKEIGFDGTRGFGGGALRIPCAYRLGNYIASLQGDIKEAVVRECETDVTGGKPRWAYGATSCVHHRRPPDTHYKAQRPSFTLSRTEKIGLFSHAIYLVFPPSAPSLSFPPLFPTIPAGFRTGADGFVDRSSSSKSALQGAP
ncbi:hypothetical protein C8R45DRAFT_1125201 [Mycena sanguinolenta]|nr:hypothetical protein C8R45DRAFT_1125201 [Mycena sanguinolenta]